MPLRIAVITISDTASMGMSVDSTGPALAERCKAQGWEVVFARIIPDVREEIEKQFATLADGEVADVILSTGGTGVAPRDTTPEAAAAVCERMLPGYGELMRAEGLKQTKRAALSRSGAGTRKNSLILFVPGSPRGALESFDAVAEIIPVTLSVITEGRRK